jgi:putative peptidoglycan lipid II flippase
MIAALRPHVARWQAWRAQSVNRRIFAAALAVGSSGLVAKLVTTAQDVLVAGRFGVGDELDAYLIAFAVPTFAINVLAGSLASALIPTYVQVRDTQGVAAARRLVASVSAATVGLLAAAAALLALAAPWLLPRLGSSFSTDKLALTHALFLLLLPVLVVSGLARCWAAILNGSERFALPALSPVTTPAGAVLALLLLGPVWGIHALALGTLAGAVVELAVLAPALRRCGLAVLPRWHGLDDALRQMLRQYVPVAAGLVLMAATTVVDQAMAATRGPGSVAALAYGTRVVTFLLGLATVLGVATLPYYAQLVARREWESVWHVLKTYAALVLLTTVPVTLLGIWLSEPIVVVLFQRGAFTAEDARLVSQIQALSFLQVPFYTLGILLVRLISALKMNHLLLWGSMLNFVVNVVCDYVFLQWLGVAGIALATAVMYGLALFYAIGALLWTAKRAVCQGAR